MAGWTDVDDDNLAPGAPARSADIIAIRDNITAQAEGATGAPKTQAAALSDELYESGQIGVFSLMRNNSSLSFSVNEETTGSNLSYSSSGGTVSGSPSSSTTWRCMGFCDGSSGSNINRTTLWLRIS